MNLHLIDQEFSNKELFSWAPDILKSRYNIMVDKLDLSELKDIIQLIVHSLNENTSESILVPVVIKAKYSVEIGQRSFQERQDIYNLLSFVLYHKEKEISFDEAS